MLLDRLLSQWQDLFTPLQPNIVQALCGLRTV